MSTWPDYITLWLVIGCVTFSVWWFFYCLSKPIGDSEKQLFMAEQGIDPDSPAIQDDRDRELSK